MPDDQVDRWEELAAEAEVCKVKSPGASPAMLGSQTSSDFRLRRRQPSMGDFITADYSGHKQHDVDASVYGRLLRFARYVVERNYTSNCLALVVLVDAYFTAYDIDARAAGKQTSAFVRTCSDLCLVLYTAELPLIFFVKGKKALKDMLVLLDIVIITCGYAEWLLTSLGNLGASSINILRPLRLARIIRLMQLLRKTRSLKELQKLVTMLATCLKTLSWCFLFLLVIMTVWAMLMVEIVHPRIKDLQDATGIFDECDQCLRAASSVMDANLLLFKTVVAGDSWGLIAVPVIEAYPGTAVIFIGSLLTLVFGVLNLIVAVVVDTFAEVRESDVINLAEELEHSLKADRKYLQKIFNRLDESGSGELTLQNLMEGARKDAEFQSRLRVMDIDEIDLQLLFEMIDADGSGTIEVGEFIAPLSRWVRDSKTAPRFIKYNLQQTMQTQEELLKLSQYSFSLLHRKMEELSEMLPGVARGAQQPSPFFDADVAAQKTTDFSVLTEPLEMCETWEAHSASLSEVPECIELEQPQLSQRKIGNIKHVSDARLSSDLGSRLQSERQSESDPLEAIREAMWALEQSMIRATEGALHQAVAIAEKLLHDRLALDPPVPPSSPHRNRRPSGNVVRKASSTADERMPDLGFRSQKLEASRRRKSVTNMLWTDF